MQFVQNSSYNYLGALASFTPIVIIYGYRLTGISAELSVERYALVRMEEISIGILVAVVVSSLLWPVSSIRLLRSEVMVSVGSFKQAVGDTMSIYDRLVRDDDLRRGEGDGSDQPRERPAQKAEQEQKADEEEEKARHTGTQQLHSSMLEEARSEVNGASQPACIPGDMSDRGAQPIPPQPVAAPDTQEMTSQLHNTHAAINFIVATHSAADSRLSHVGTALYPCHQCSPLCCPTPTACRCLCPARPVCWASR